MADPGPTLEPNQRGFYGTGEVAVDYGARVRIAESSAAKGPCIWLFYDGSVSVDPASHNADWMPGETMRPHDIGNAGIHMTLAQAEEVHAHLGAMIEFMRTRDRDWIGEVTAEDIEAFKKALDEQPSYDEPQAPTS